MDPNFGHKFVWFPSAEHGFAIGKIVDISQNGVGVEPVAQPSQTGLDLVQVDSSSKTGANQQQFAYRSVYPCDKVDVKTGKLDLRQISVDVDDNCALINLNEASLLENIRVRFQRDKIYTYVAHILIAVNPYFAIKNLHSPEAILKYQGKSLGTLPPHVFAIADKAYRDMKAFKQSQSIIISGESGAGKTESQKYVLRHLCLSGSQSGRLEKLILDANPLLEAFGNAKTIRNNNSSRFGKFIEIHYSSKFNVTGGLFFHYLLEKSRICTQSAGERNYHIFYQLCACLPRNLHSQLELNAPDNFRYLSGGCTQYFCSKDRDKSLPGERKSQDQLKYGSIQDQLIDDVECFDRVNQALDNFGVNGQQKVDIYSIVAAVLHLGNVSFCDDLDDNRGGCKIDDSDETAERALQTTARLMGLDCDLLRQSLTSRVMSTSRAGHKGTVYMVQLSVQQAQAARDALAKAIYSKLFDYVVARIVNKSIPFSSSSYYIGVLDVAGFEYFQHNSFEQFLINFCNEKLQQFFNERILKEEQNIYEKEGLNLGRVEFVDNQDCIQLFEAKSKGIFDLLDEESRLPKPSAQHFTQSVHSVNKGHFRLAVPRTSKLKSHREIRDDEGFLVRHFAGAVCYETNSFIDKNNDALHASLKSLMLEADHQMLRDLFQDSVEPAARSHPQVAVQFSNSTTGGPSNKLNFISVGTTFRSQLNELMTKLKSTGSHFIRCIKPNNEMVAHKFEGGQILSQLHCSGMDSVLELMQRGYPSRSSFNDLYNCYKRFLPTHLARLDAHLFCRALFKALGLSDKDFRFGSSKVFFRPGKFAEFDQIIKSDPEHVAQLVQKVSKWLICSRWRKAQFCCLSVIKLHKKIIYRRNLIIKLQKNWRLALVTKQIKYKLNAIRLARSIERSLIEFDGILQQQLKKSPEKPIFEQETKLLRQEVSSFVESIKSAVRSDANRQTEQNNNNKPTLAGKLDKTECQSKLDKLSTKRDLLLRSIRDKIEAKQKELLELEQQVALESKQREMEELAKRRELDLKQQRGELELRRQNELERLAKPQQSNSHTIKSSVQTSINLAQQDQEQRDYEVALRLAQESRTGDSPVLPPSENFANNSLNASKFDLTKWKYSDLRDTINTSCDLELLEACKREFHRRLKVYHAWRAANSRHLAATASEASPHPARAPSCVMENGARSESDTSSMSSLESNSRRASEQRYFRIPFVRGATSSRGWWFAHFDGQWIARQLELHPDKEPILLTAGQHDIDMCELSLKETKLASKRGAEILAQEFEEEWRRHGGSAYVRKSPLESTNTVRRK